jgi:hypothetical protein
MRRPFCRELIRLGTRFALAAFTMIHFFALLVLFVVDLPCPVANSGKLSSRLISNPHARERAIGVEKDLEIVPAELGVEVLQESCIPEQGIPQSGGDKAHDGRPLVRLQETVGDPQLNAAYLQRTGCGRPKMPRSRSSAWLRSTPMRAAILSSKTVSSEPVSSSPSRSHARPGPVIRTTMTGRGRIRLPPSEGSGATARAGR